MIVLTASCYELLLLAFRGGGGLGLRGCRFLAGSTGRFLRRGRALARGRGRFRLLGLVRRGALLRALAGWSRVRLVLRRTPRALLIRRNLPGLFGRRRMSFVRRSRRSLRRAHVLRGLEAGE